MLKDYLNAEERKDVLSIGFLLDIVATVKEQWGATTSITKEEQKNLRASYTFLHKFYEALISRMSRKEIEALSKRQASCEMFILDAHTKRKIYGSLADNQKDIKMNVDEFFDFCEQIQDIRCRNCQEKPGECDLYEVLDSNCVADAGEDLPTCRYAYTGETERANSETQKLKDGIKGIDKENRSVKKDLEASKEEIKELEFAVKLSAKSLLEIDDLKNQMINQEQMYQKKAKEQQERCDAEIKYSRDQHIAAESKLIDQDIKHKNIVATAESAKYGARVERRKVLDLEDKIRNISMIIQSKK